MRSVQEWIPQVELVIVGDGPLRASLERQAAETLCRYSFLGLQTPEQIHIWMNRATVLCAPSITAQSGDAEGLPMVVVEALSMGLPVAAFSSAGIPEAVADGETGLLAPERDWRSLAANIAKLLTDGAAWESMSRAGQQRVRRDFNLRRQCEKLEQIYDEIRSRYRIEGSI
jgi:glycosyltransferase involved in cell wall biosynthesis